MSPGLVTPEDGWSAVLRRAAELEAGGTHGLANLRATAAEAGIRPEFVDAAFADLVGRGARDLAPVPRWRRWAARVLVVTGAGAQLFVSTVHGTPADFVVSAVCLGVAALGLRIGGRR